MSHHFTSGFVTHEAAWHGLATISNKEIFSSAEAISLAGCDWEVVKRQHYVETNELDQFAPVPNCFGVYRKDTNDYLGKCGSGYRPLQNADAFKFFDPMLADRSIYIDTAGSLRGGKIIWVQAKIAANHSAEIVPGDVVTQRLLLANSHDMSIPLEISWPTTRVVCANTLGSAQRETAKSKNHYRVRHTSNMLIRLEDVQNAVNLAQRDFSRNVEDYKFLASRDMTVVQMRGFLETIYASELSKELKREEPRTLDNYKPTARILELYQSSPDLQADGVRGTAYAAYNALTEYVTHEQEATVDNNVYSLWFGDSKKFVDLSLGKLLTTV